MNLFTSSLYNFAILCPYKITYLLHSIFILPSKYILRWKYITAGNLDNRSHWFRIINLMEHFRGTCGSEVVSYQHSLQRESGRWVLRIFISFSSLKGFITKNGMLFDRHESLPSKYVKGIEQSPRGTLAKMKRSSV